MTLDDMVNKYIVTAAQLGAAPHAGFSTALSAYAKRIDATIVVVPMNGAYKEDEMHPDIAERGDYIITNSFEFNKNFEVADIPVRAQQILPTTGLGRFIQHNRSAIIGAPKQHMVCEPTSNVDIPKILTTTGAITKPNYREHLLIGNIAARDHTYGAIVVEAEKDWFQYRHITANQDGSFCDLDARVNSNGKIVKNRPDALVLGDLHSAQADPTAIEASIKMIRDLKPKYLILHDLFDGYSISHHDMGKQVTRAKKADALNLHDELYKTGEMLEKLWSELPNDGKVIVVKSNHDEFLDRYLDAGRYGEEPQNLLLSSKLAQAYLEGKDPLQFGIEEVYGKFGASVKFLSRDEDFKVRGWQLGAHGDLGGNGSRGSVTQQQKNYGKSIVAHRHTPGIRGDAWCVGTNTYLKMDYNRGPSSWMQTNALVHPTGKAQLVNIMDGRYKF